MPVPLGFRFGLYNNLAALVATPATTDGLAFNRGQLAGRSATGFLNLTETYEIWASPEGDVTNIRTHDAGMYYTSSVGAMANAASAYTIERSIEYPSGTFHRATYSAVNAGVVPVGGVLTSDVVISSVTGLPLVVPAGQKAWARTYIVAIASGSSIPVMAQYSGTPSAMGLSDGGASGASKVMGGTINPSTSNNTYGPFAVTGSVGKANARSWALLGDSVMFGNHDATSVGAKGGSGMFARALDPLYPYVKISLNGARIDDLDSPTNRSRLATLMAAIQTYGGVSDVLSNYGINDLSNGNNVAGTTAAITSIFTNVFPTKRCYQATLGPRTTSATSNWTAAPGDQVIQTGDSWNTEFPAFNAAVRATLSGATGYVEAGNLLFSSADSGYWAAHTPAWTDDGTHPVSAGAAGAAAGMIFP